MLHRTVALVLLVDGQFRICRACAASPLVKGERIEVRGWCPERQCALKLSLTLPLSLYKGEAIRTSH
jgi:hypothetical protein